MPDVSAQGQNNQKSGIVFVQLPKYYAVGNVWLIFVHKQVIIICVDIFCLIGCDLSVKKAVREEYPFA